MGDLGEEEEPGEGKVMLFPTDDEKLFLLEPLLRLSSLGVLSTERLTNGPSVLKQAKAPFWSTDRDLSRPEAGDGEREVRRITPEKLPPLCFRC